MWVTVKWPFLKQHIFLACGQMVAYCCMKEAKIHSAISNSLSIAIFMSTEWTVIKTGLIVLSNAYRYVKTCVLRISDRQRRSLISTFVVCYIYLICIIPQLFVTGIPSL